MIALILTQMRIRVKCSLLWDGLLSSAVRGAGLFFSCNSHNNYYINSRFFAAITKCDSDLLSEDDGETRGTANPGLFFFHVIFSFYMKKQHGQTSIHYFTL